MIVPAIEKIILLANVGNSNLKETASPLIKKFVTSSIMGCLGIGAKSNKGFSPRCYWGHEVNVDGYLQ
eukprot:2681207-Heterocapsa_arctica.AAC.1